jgi:uncharacterized RDD family membrane protein YckC
MSGELSTRAGLTLQGHYAGAASRLAAYLIDQGVLGLMFLAASAVVSYSIDLFLPDNGGWEAPTWVVASLYGLWYVAYFAIPWSVSGKSLGMLVVGIRVVRGDGSALGGPSALVRALVLPLGFVTAGLTFIGIVVGRRHRALQDCAAGSVVVYDWDARAARLRVMARPDVAAPGDAVSA